MPVLAPPALTTAAARARVAARSGSAGGAPRPATRHDVAVLGFGFVWDLGHNSDHGTSFVTLLPSSSSLVDPYQNGSCVSQVPQCASHYMFHQKILAEVCKNQVCRSLKQRDELSASLIHRWACYVGLSGVWCDQL
jgi:hypothetical protein